MKFRGQRLTVARAARGFTQDDLGKYLGVSGSTVSKYEIEAVHPKSEHISKMCLKLNITPNFLFCVSGYSELDDLECKSIVAESDSAIISVLTKVIAWSADLGLTNQQALIDELTTTTNKGNR